MLPLAGSADDNFLISNSNNRYNMTIDTTRTVSEIVAEDYRTAAVFQSHGIDFCCGGKISLDEVC